MQKLKDNHADGRIETSWGNVGTEPQGCGAAHRWIWISSEISSPGRLTRLKISWYHLRPQNPKLVNLLVFLIASTSRPKWMMKALEHGLTGREAPSCNQKKGADQFRPWGTDLCQAVGEGDQHPNFRNYSARIKVKSKNRPVLCFVASIRQQKWLASSSLLLILDMM